MQIALTGATGFIGRRLCASLAGDGHDVRALARDPRAAAIPGGPRVTLVAGDLGSARALEQLVLDADAVIHLAGAVRGRCAGDFDAVNVEGTARLLAALERAAPRAALLHFSSLAAREPGLSHYARSKQRAEQLLAARAGNARCLILRPPAVYGPGDREMLPVFRFMARTGLAPATAAPGARLSLLFVDDLVRAVHAWLTGGLDLHATLELDDGHPGGYDWPALAQIVASVCQRRVRVWQVPRPLLDAAAHVNAWLARFGNRAPMLTPEKLRELRHPDWVCDNTEITRALGWAPRIGLEEGLRLTPGWNA